MFEFKTKEKYYPKVNVTCKTCGKTFSKQKNDLKIWRGNCLTCSKTPFKDLTGKKFGKITALSRTGEKDENGSYLWNCICECGNSYIGTSKDLKHIKSCGCLKYKLKTEPGIAGLTQAYGACRGSAKKRGIEFSLTKEEFKNLSKLNCNYCGCPPNNQTANKQGTEARMINSNYIHSGLDRINNNEGYHTNNVTPCCKICNISKNNLTIEQFNEWLDRIIDFRMKQLYIDIFNRN